jgi:ribosomal subunit interface protein
MHLYVTGRHLELTDSIHEYVRRRLLEPVQSHADARDIRRMEVQLYAAPEGDVRFGCHILLQLPQHHDLNIREETTDLYEAIDRAEKRLLRQLVDQRARARDQSRHGS